MDKNHLNKLLLYSSKHGYLDMLEMLIENGADINAKTKDGTTPLMYAVIHRNLDVIKMLIEKGADVNAESEGGWTAYSTALSINFEEGVKLLSKYQKPESAKRPRRIKNWILTESGKLVCEIKEVAEEE